VLFFIFLKMTKAIIKAIIATFLILLLVLVVIGFFVYKDIKEGKYTFKEKIFDILKIKSLWSNIGNELQNTPQQQIINLLEIT